MFRTSRRHKCALRALCLFLVLSLGRLCAAKEVESKGVAERFLHRALLPVFSDDMCPQERKKSRKCLDVSNVCVKNSCIVGSESICGNLSVDENINLVDECSCCVCKPKIIGTISGSFHPDALVLHSIIDLNVDFQYPTDAPFPGFSVPQGCLAPFKNQFKNPCAQVRKDSDIDVIEASISDIKGVVLDSNDRTQFAIEFKVLVGYPGFASPPVIMFDYHNRSQVAALPTLVSVRSEMLAVYNVGLLVTEVQRGQATLSVIFYFDASTDSNFDSLAGYDELLLFAKNVINSTSLSVKLLGFSQ